MQGVLSSQRGADSVIACDRRIAQAVSNNAHPRASYPYQKGNPMTELGFPAHEAVTPEITPGSLPEGAPQLHPNHHDVYYWHAIYNDETSLLEVDGDVMHAFSEIDQDRLTGFILHPVLEGYPQYGVAIDNGKRLIFTRRRTTSYNQNDGSVSWTVWHLLGYQQTLFPDTDHEKNVKSLLFISANGSSFMTDDANPELGG